MFLAWSGLFLALFWGWYCGVVWDASLIDEAIDFSVVQSSWKVSALALVIDGFITGERSLWRQNWIREIVGPAPSVSDGADGSDTVGGGAVALVDNFSGAVWILCSEIVSLGNDSVFIASIAQVELLFVWGLRVQYVFNVNKLVSLEHWYSSDFEWGAQGIFLGNVWVVVYVSSLDVGAGFPEWVDQGAQHDYGEDTEHDVVCVLVEEALLFFGSLSEGFSGSFLHFGISFVGRSSVFFGRFGFGHDRLKSFICNNVNVYIWVMK